MVLGQLYKPPGDLQELLVQGVLWSPELLDDVLHSRWLELRKPTKDIKNVVNSMLRQHKIIFTITQNLSMEDWLSERVDYIPPDLPPVPWVPCIFPSSGVSV